MIGVLRTEAARSSSPGTDDHPARRSLRAGPSHRARSASTGGEPFSLGAATELTVYRILQEH